MLTVAGASLPISKWGGGDNLRLYKVGPNFHEPLTFLGCHQKCGGEDIFFPFSVIHKCIFLGNILGVCYPEIVYLGIYSSIGFCPPRILLSLWVIVLMGFCLLGITSTWILS